MKLNTFRNYTSYETVRIADLAEGDLILQHGAIFRLANRRPWDDGETISFDGWYVGPAFSDQESSIPAHWRPAGPDLDIANGEERPWQVQSNHLVRWLRITDPKVQYSHGLDDDGTTIWADDPVVVNYVVTERPWYNRTRVRDLRNFQSSAEAIAFAKAYVDRQYRDWYGEDVIAAKHRDAWHITHGNGQVTTVEVNT